MSPSSTVHDGQHDTEYKVCGIRVANACGIHGWRKLRFYAWTSSYLCIFPCTTFRHSATTSATLLIRKSTTRWWTLRCALSTATIVAEVWKCGSRGLDLVFPVLYLSNIFTAVRTRTSTCRVVFSFFFRVRAAKKQACGTIWHAT